jgi:adenylate cyclase
MPRKKTGLERRRKILIVDDEPETIFIIKDRLEANNFEVLTAVDGEEGLKKAEEKPDAILLDIMMPNMDGYEVARKLREDDRTKKIPIVMLTARGEPQAVERAFSLGAVDYIVKPIDLALLMDKIWKTLG